ncbi:hypothetical protein KO507_07340 [Gilvimarinus agarilyticus]|uniref:hypothetical protein n=1 Tax=unclassified Gilvimarinus TaxID=2642066 RepID=UPI001C090343|nr:MULTISPECIES: hypothetical protein [unclassified Gilvimarinus]MBU2885572.1 hypothetical protein [Gilvimarinus agarilyticus]MDO6570439.1 hypothetical protein [Gilvimarinus sp. 2_MG-2023]MDO6746491.1 hypothetical protein [Gilvimarinus sp. 1_MG-2023]
MTLNHPKFLIANACIAGLTLACGQAMADDQARLDNLEQQIQVLQQQVNKPIQERLRFNGFMSLAYGVASNDSGFAGYTEDGTFSNESLFGLQGSFTISDTTDITMQLVGRGNDEWDPNFEWAYISHQFSPNLKMRAGKMRLPLFMYSDSLEVGYAQPWGRPPIDVYGGIPITSYTGVDALYDINFDTSTLSLQGFGGETDDSVDIAGQLVDVNVDNLYGGAVSWTDFIWTVRSNYATAELAVSGDTFDTHFYGVGLSFNNGTWQVISELTRFEVDGPIVDSDSAYITVARTFGSFSPYVTLSVKESIDDEERPLTRAQVTTPGSPVYGLVVASDIQNIERTSQSVGVRWDAMSNIAIKFDLSRVSGFGDTGGNLNGNIGPVINYDDADIFSIKLDAAF